MVDAEGYRQRREDTLATMARRLGKQALEEGKIITFEPMSPRDRRIVHLALAKFAGVVTKSDGEGEGRRVQIIPVRRSTIGRRRRLGGSGGDCVAVARPEVGGVSKAGLVRHRCTRCLVGQANRGGSLGRRLRAAGARSVLVAPRAAKAPPAASTERGIGALISPLRDVGFLPFLQEARRAGRQWDVFTIDRSASGRDRFFATLTPSRPEQF